MTKLTKILLGAAAVAVVGTVVAVVEKKKHDEKYVEVAKTEDKEEDKSLLKKIKRYVEKKVIKILGWVALHMEQIESVSAIIGLASGAISIASAVKDYKNKTDQEKQLEELIAFNEKFTKAWDGTLDAYDSNWDNAIGLLNNINAKLPEKEKAA